MDIFGLQKSLDRVLSGESSEADPDWFIQYTASRDAPHPVRKSLTENLMNQISVCQPDKAQVASEPSHTEGCYSTSEMILTSLLESWKPETFSVDKLQQQQFPCSCQFSLDYFVLLP
jgi:hypothetical protein